MSVMRVENVFANFEHDVNICFEYEGKVYSYELERLYKSRYFEWAYPYISDHDHVTREKSAGHRSRPSGRRREIGRSVQPPAGRSCSRHIRPRLRTHFRRALVNRDNRPGSERWAAEDGHG